MDRLPFSPLGFTDLVNQRQALKLPQNLDALSAGLPQQAPQFPISSPWNSWRQMIDRPLSQMMRQYGPKVSDEQLPYGMHTRQDQANPSQDFLDLLQSMKGMRYR